MQVFYFQDRSGHSLRFQTDSHRSFSSPSYEKKRWKGDGTTGASSFGPAVPFSPSRVFANLSICIGIGRHGGVFLRTEVFVASIEYSQVRKGMVIVGEGGQLLHVVDRDLNTPGNWRAILQLKLKNLKTGSITINRVRPQDKVEQAYLDKREMQYLYKDGDSYVFMDTESYDQYHLQHELVGELMLYLKEGEKAHI